MSICGTSQSIIQVDNLIKHNGSKTIVQDITFCVKKGERLGIFGPEGSGKTTIMRILTAYVPPSGGAVTVAGYDVFTQSCEVRKRIGYLPQSVCLYVDMTVFDYLNFVAALHKVDNRTERVWQTLERVDLADVAEERIGKLPPDICKYVGLAQAIVHAPAVLVLDEPTTGLNPQQIVKMHTLIQSLHHEFTIVLGTRTLSEAEQLCNRVLMLGKGRIVAEDTPAHLTARLQGGQRIQLQTLFAPPDAVDILQSQAGVNRVSVVEPGLFEIECACSVDCRPVVAKTVVQQGWGLLELQVVDASLEDVYVELTANPVAAVV